jgi:hypothetical protein
VALRALGAEDLVAAAGVTGGGLAEGSHSHVCMSSLAIDGRI